MAGNAKFATGYVELKLGDDSVLMRATQATAKRVAAAMDRSLSGAIGRSIDRVGDRLSSIGESASLYLAPITIGLGAAAVEGWKVAQAVSQSANMFEQFNMSASAATGFVDELFRNAQSWGVSFVDTLGNAQKFMAAFHGDLAQVKTAMSGLANLTGKYHLNQEQTNGVLRAFVQVAQKGKVQAEEMLQVSENGANGWQLLADATGKSVAELQKLSMAGQLLADDVMPKVYEYLNTDPDFAGKAAAQAETLGGQMAILKNNMGQIFGGPLSKESDVLVAAFKNLNLAIENLNNSGFVATFLTPLINGFASLTNWLASLSPATVSFVASLLGIAGVVGPILLVVGKLLSLLGSGLKVFGRTSTSISTVTRTMAGGFKAAFVYFRDSWRTAPPAIGRTARAVDTAALSIALFGDKLLRPIATVKQLPAAFARAKNAVSSFADTVATGIGVAAITAKDKLDLLRTGIGVLAIDFRGKLVSAARVAGDRLKNLGTWAAVVGIDLRTKLVSGARAAQAALRSGLLSAATATATGLKKLGSVAAGAARDGLAAVGRNAGALASGGLNALKFGLAGAAIGMVTLLASGEQIGPTIEQIGQKIVGVVQNIPTLVSELGSQLPGIISDLATSLSTAAPAAFSALADSLPQIAAAVSDAIPLIFQAIQDSLPEISRALSEAVPQIAAGFTENAPELQSSAVKIVDALLTGLTSLLPVLLEAGVKIITSILSGLSTSLPQLITVVVSAIPKIAIALITAIPQLVIAFLSAIPKIVAGLAKELPKIITTIVSAIPKIISALATALPQIVQAFVLLIPQTVAALAPEIPSIVKAVLKSVPQIIEAVIAAIPDIVSSFVDMIPEIGSALADAGVELYEAGKELMKELWDGIKSMFSSIGEGVSEFFSDINPFSAETEATVGVTAKTGRLSPQLKSLTASLAPAVDVAQATRRNDLATLSGGGLMSFEIKPDFTTPNVQVRVFIGDTELTDIVRTQVSDDDSRAARLISAGVI